MDELLAMKRKYENLKVDVNNIISKLNRAIECLSVPAEKIKNAYIIDSVSVDNGKLNTVRQNLINKRDYLSNNVLYSIRREIEEISNEINNRIESVG